jgi:hypothetical protein
MTTRQPILQALREVAADEVNRHLRTTRDWAPHDYVPWSRGRDFPAMSQTGQAWHPHQSTVSPLGRAHEGARAQQEVGRHLEELDGQARRLDERLAARKARHRSGEPA